MPSLSPFVTNNTSVQDLSHDIRLSPGSPPRGVLVQVGSVTFRGSLAVRSQKEYAVLSHVVFSELP